MSLQLGQEMGAVLKPVQEAWAAECLLYQRGAVPARARGGHGSNLELYRFCF